MIHIMKIQVSITKDATIRWLPFMIGFAMTAAWTILFKIISA